MVTISMYILSVYGTFCTSHSRAYILCCIEHFLHFTLHFVLYTAVFVHQTIKHTLCARCILYGSFCTCISKYLSQNVSWLWVCMWLLFKLRGCLSRRNCSLISLSSSARLSFFEGCGFGTVSSSMTQVACCTPSLVRSVTTSYC